MNNDQDWTFGDEGFVKLYGDKLLQSSLMDEKVVTRWVFVAMLSAADSGGRVRAQTMGALARLVAVTLQDAIDAVKALETPDPSSSTKDDQGRRIRRIDGGWQIVSYQKYRAYRTKRQIADAERKRLARAASRVAPSQSRVTEPKDGPRANPLVTGKRADLERELSNLVQHEAGLTDRDPAEVLAEVSSYEGSRRLATNPASMTDDRLLNSVLDARARVKALEAQRAKQR